MRMIVASILLLLATYSQVVGQGTSEPSALPIDESRRSKIDKLFSAWDRPDSPGCSVAVMKGDQIIYKRGYGMSNLEYDIPISSSSIFHVASISKQFTNMSILLLAQDGKLSLDDDIRMYLPEVPNFGHKITIRHLIYHTSGIRDQWVLLYMAGWRLDDPKTEDDVLELISRQKDLSFKPGDEFAYNNTGYTLMAVIVKRVTGKTLRQFAEERIFKPLAMNSTHFHDDHTMIVKNRTSAYFPKRGGGWAIRIPVYDNAGATSLFTTVEDLSRWQQNFYDKRVGGEAVINQMLTLGALNNGEKLPYAAGLIVTDYRGLKTVSHSGADAGYRAHLIGFPEKQISVASLCNVSSAFPKSLSIQVADIVLEGQFKSGQPVSKNDSTVIKLSTDQLKEWAGIYLNPKTFDVRRFNVIDGKLIVMNRGMEVKPLSNNRFFNTSILQEYSFQPAVEGGGARLIETYLVSDNYKPAIFELVKPVTFSSSQLDEFTGKFYSEELDTTYTLIKKDDVLSIQRKKYPATKLLSLSIDTFISDELGHVTFVRDDKGKVTGMNISLDRARNLRFSKTQLKN